MRTVTFATVALGDELLSVQAEPERLIRQDDPLLWSEVAHVATGGANWLWRITARVLVVRADEAALEGYLASLVASLRGATGDLMVKEDGLTQLTYPGCRLDAVQRSGPPEPGRANFEAPLTFHFSSTSDPVSS